MAGCIPCFIIPLLLFLFHKFIQPLVLKFWNPWAGKEDKDGNIVPDALKCPCDQNGTCERPTKPDQSGDTVPLLEETVDNKLKTN